MPFNAYHFVTVWRVPATVAEVVGIIANGPDLVRWWPSVYLDVQELEPGDESGRGKVIALYTKGWLPYTLRWQFTISDVRKDGFTLVASGDFVGRGIWTFAQDGPIAVITYDWQVEAAKPLLRFLSPLLKPIFAANHRWAMAQGEHGLKLELARRRAATPVERNQVPLPPGPTRLWPGLLLGSGAVVLVIIAFSRARWGALRNKPVRV